MLGRTEVRPNRPRDGRHCDLCGCSQPAVRCDKCGCQIFCLSCDDMYHRHPKRTYHLRKAVDPTPATLPARPVLPMKISHLPTKPGDPSKMPLPPPRRKKPGKSIFNTFRRGSPTSDNSPDLPKREYSWSDRLGSIKKFMSNRPLPPLPNNNAAQDGQPTSNGQPTNQDLSFIHKRVDDRPPELPQRSPRPQDTPNTENQLQNMPVHPMAEVRNGTIETNHFNRNRGFSVGEENQWNNRIEQNQNHPQQFNTLSRHGQHGFMPQSGPGFAPTPPGGMHQSSSATDLHSMSNMDGMHVPTMPPPQYPHYPMQPHMPPHYPYPMYPQYPNYPGYFGKSFVNLANNPPSDQDFSDHSETSSSRHHSSKKHPFRKRAKRSQSVMVDRVAYPGQFFPFGPFPPGYGPGPWGAPLPMEAPPSPASSIRSLNTAGRSRRRKKTTSEEEDEEFSLSSSPLSRAKSSSSDRPPRATKTAPLATQTTSEEESEDGEENQMENQRRIRNDGTLRRNSDPRRSPSPLTKTSYVEAKKTAKQKKVEAVRQSDAEVKDFSPSTNDRRLSKDSNADRDEPQQPSPAPATTYVGEWHCKHCTFLNPASNKICQVCCKTATPPDGTSLMSSRPNSGESRKQSLSSDRSCSSLDKKVEDEEDPSSNRDKQDMDILNSALDEAEKEISRGLEELMKLKEDISIESSTTAQTKNIETQPTNEVEIKELSKPVYKSTGKMRSSILEKLNLAAGNKAAKPTTSTSTDTQTFQNHDNSEWTMDKVLEARRPSTSSTTSDAYNSPIAQSPELSRNVKISENNRKDSSCQTQQDTLMEYLERKRAEEEAFLGRPAFGYGDRIDTMTSPLPSMYDRFYGGGFGMMQRSHSRASLFAGRMNDPGPMDYGNPGFGFGPSPMYRSVSRSSLTGDFPESRLSEFHNLRKPDFYLSMEELVERRRQETMRAQGLELVRMIREAEQQGFTADDIQVALSNCGNKSPMDWLLENWRNMLDSVVTLSTNYGNDKKENDIGVLSENEARDALRLHKGNIWAAVTECVENRQRKFLELSARGKFSCKDIVDALTSSQGDVEMAYAKLTKSTGKPFLMRIWGAGEGVANQDGAMPVGEDWKVAGYYDGKDRLEMDDYQSEDSWDDEAVEDEVDWDDDGEEDEEEKGDLDELQTCHEDIPRENQSIKTPESDKSDYCDAFGAGGEDRNASSPSDDVFFVIPEAKPEKKKGSGLLSKLAALRRDSKDKNESASTFYDRDSLASDESGIKEETTSDSGSNSDQHKSYGPLNIIKNTISAIRDTVSGSSKSEKKLPCAAPERRTIIVKGNIDHESLSSKSENEVIKLKSIKLIENELSKSPFENAQENKVVEPNNSEEGNKIKENKTDCSNELKTEAKKLNSVNETKLEASQHDVLINKTQMDIKTEKFSNTRNTETIPVKSDVNGRKLNLEKAKENYDTIKLTKDTKFNLTTKEPLGKPVSLTQESILKNIEDHETIKNNQDDREKQLKVETSKSEKLSASERTSPVVSQSQLKENIFKVAPLTVGHNAVRQNVQQEGNFETKSPALLDKSKDMRQLRESPIGKKFENKKDENSQKDSISKKNMDGDLKRNHEILEKTNSTTQRKNQKLDQNEELSSETENKAGKANHSNLNTEEVRVIQNSTPKILEEQNERNHKAEIKSVSEGSKQNFLENIRKNSPFPPSSETKTFKDVKESHSKNTARQKQETTVNPAKENANELHQNLNKGNVNDNLFSVDINERKFCEEKNFNKSDVVAIKNSEGDSKRPIMKQVDLQYEHNENNIILPPENVHKFTPDFNSVSREDNKHQQKIADDNFTINVLPNKSDITSQETGVLRSEGNKKEPTLLQATDRGLNEGVLQGAEVPALKEENVTEEKQVPSHSATPELQDSTETKHKTTDIIKEELITAEKLPENAVNSGTHSFTSSDKKSPDNFKHITDFNELGAQNLEIGRENLQNKEIILNSKTLEVIPIPLTDRTDQNKNDTPHLKQSEENEESTPIVDIPEIKPGTPLNLKSENEIPQTIENKEKETRYIDHQNTVQASEVPQINKSDLSDTYVSTQTPDSIKHNGNENITDINTSDHSAKTEFAASTDIEGKTSLIKSNLSEVETEIVGSDAMKGETAQLKLENETAIKSDLTNNEVKLVKSNLMKGEIQLLKSNLTEIETTTELDLNKDENVLVKSDLSKETEEMARLDKAIEGRTSAESNLIRDTAAPEPKEQQKSQLVSSISLSPEKSGIVASTSKSESINSEVTQIENKESEETKEGIVIMKGVKKKSSKFNTSKKSLLNSESKSSLKVEQNKGKISPDLKTDKFNGTKVLTKNSKGDIASEGVSYSTLTSQSVSESSEKALSSGNILKEAQKSTGANILDNTSTSNNEVDTKTMPSVKETASSLTASASSVESKQEVNTNNKLDNEGAKTADIDKSDTIIAVSSNSEALELNLEPGDNSEGSESKSKTSSEPNKDVDMTIGVSDADMQIRDFSSNNEITNQKLDASSENTQESKETHSSASSPVPASTDVQHHTDETQNVSRSSSPLNDQEISRSPSPSVSPIDNLRELILNASRRESRDNDDMRSTNSSRRSSMTAPSPVDTLRSRFEGLIEGGGSAAVTTSVRPQSPFRRMSFNSRKQAIALERRREATTEKPWFLEKSSNEPAKPRTGKRSIKQQLEMERKVRKMVADRKCRTYKKAEIVVQLMDMNFEEEEAIQAANECSTLEQALSYLQQECLLCAGHFSVSQIISMVHCPHKACRQCLRAYFTVQIRDRTIMEMLCPFCNEPDISDEDVAQDYFNHLDIMLKKLVDTEIYELFQRKLRDRVLMRDPNFRWCSQCSSGFIAMPNLKRLICPDCNAVTCASCRRPWEREHQGISCEAFAAWKDATDPEAQAAGLAKLLTEDGIDCPSCHFRYQLAKGGCMHFRCIQCQHDFCSGCSRPFKMGQKCGVSEFCVKLGLHAHHPRSCLFYLRDKEPEDLQRLLDMCNVKYNCEPPDGMEVKSTCQVMEQKETPDGMVDDYCGKDVQQGFAGLCRLHYVEYLGQLVNKNKVDPIQIFDNDDLELVLKRANIRLPPKRYRETDDQYREKLVALIQDELPLDKIDGS